MKRKMMMKLFGSAVVVAFAVTAHGVTGSSAWFFVDTTVGTLKIADVRSKYFDGEYGGVGRKATFLNGVSCDIEMTILMDDYSKVDHWLVNGREVTTRTFMENVGSLAVGGRLEVIAVGKEDGVRSKPFRANFDIAEHVDEEHAGLWVARPSNSEGIDEIRYTPIGSGSFTFPLAPEKSGAKPSKLNWLPGDEWSICPKIELKLEVRSSGNGSCTFGTAGLEVGTSGSEGTASHKRNRRAVGKFARVMDKDVGITFTGGPLTMSWNAQKKKWVAEDVSFGGEVSGSLGVTHHYPTPIGPVFYEIKGEAALAGIFRVSGLDSALGGLGWGGLETSFSISSDRLPKVSVGGGYGINHIACLKGTVSGMSVLDATYSNGEWHDFRWGLRGSGAVTATFLIFDGKLFELTSDTWWIINNTSPKSMRLMSGAPSSGIEWQLQSRDYLKKGTPRMRLMAVAQADGVVESGGYPNPAPAMASGTVGDALAYLRDNAERTSANRTELVLRTGTSNEWNAAETVWDDGTADFMPEIAAMPDGSFVATWVNTGRTFSDDVTLPEMCGAMEIAVGVRNAATGAWSCRNLTADSVLDFAPVVRAGTNGTALVAWLRNAAGSLVGSAAEPTDIMVSVYANGTWSAPAAVVSGAGSVSGFDVAFDGENAVLAFSKDADGNQETMGDMEIFAVRFNGAAWDEPARLTYAGVSDGQPFVRGGAGTGFAVLWTEKGALMETTELAVSNAVAVAAADGWMLSGGCSVMRGVDGRDALVWGGDSDAGGVANAPVAMMYDPVCGAWGAPRKLLDDGRYERQLAGAVGADGGIRIGYESSSVLTNAEGEVIFGDVELRTRFIPATCDLAVVEDGFSFASEDLADGDETVLTVKVVNLGFKTATNATVTVYEGVGDEKGELESVVTNFPGGGVVAVNVPWTVDNTQSNLQFTVEIDAGGNEDEGMDGNNVYIWNAGAYDVSFVGVAVRNESTTRRLLTAAVSNVGLGPLPNGGKVVFRRGGENGDVLGVDEIGTVWPGTNGVYNAGFAWDMEGVTFTSAWETVCVQLFPDGVVGSALEAADMAFVQVSTTQNAGEDPEAVLHTVTFDLGEHGTRTGGGELTQTVTNGCLAVAPEVAANQGWAFTGWDADVTAVITSNVTFTAQYAQLECWLGSETVDGVEWKFFVSNGVAAVTSGTNLAAIAASTSGAIVVPSTLGGCLVTHIGDYAFYNCGELTSVTIPQSVTSIGNYAFLSCVRLVNFVIPDSVTSIGKFAFFGCKGLVDMPVPDSVVNIGRYAFYGSILQPFLGMTSGKVNNRDVLMNVDGDISRMIEENMTMLDVFSLYDYLDENDIPVSLALPTTERVPMICGLQSYIQLTFKPMVTTEDVVEGGAKRKPDCKSVGDFYIEKTSCFLNLQDEGGFSTMYMFPFRRDNGAPNVTYTSETAIRICFGVETPGLRTRSNSPYVLQQAAEFEATGVGGCAMRPKVQSNTLTFSEVDKPEDAIKKNDVAINFNEVRSWFQQNALFWVKKKFVVTAIDPVTSTPVFSEDTGFGEAGVNDDFHPVNKDGTGNGGFTADLIKQGGKVVVRPYMTIASRITRNGDTLDLVPACVRDDAKYNGVNNDVNIGNIGGTSATTPIITFCGDKDIEFSLEAFQKGDPIEVKISPTEGQSIFCPDPRWNFAPENFVRINQTLDPGWYTNAVSPKCGLGLDGRDSDIFMFVSNQGYMQSVSEIAFLPRTSVSAGSGSVITGDAAFSFDYNDFPNDVTMSKNWNLMWRTYRHFSKEVLSLIFPSDTIPQVDANAVPEVIAKSIDEAGIVNVDEVKATIGGDATKYMAFKSWAGNVAGGEAAVVANTNAAVAFLLGAERLFENAPTIEIDDFAVVTSAPLSSGGGLGHPTDMTVSVTVRDGDDAVQCAAEKVKDMFEATTDLGDWDGGRAGTRDPTGHTLPVAVEIAEPVVGDSGETMRFNVTPGDGTSPKAFLRVRVK